MSTEVSRGAAYGSSRTTRPESYAVRRPAASSPYLAARELEEGMPSPKAPPSAYSATWVAEERRRIPHGVLMGASVLVLVLALSFLLGGGGSGPAGLRLSRYSPLGPGSALAAGLAEAPAKPGPAAAPAPRPAPATPAAVADPGRPARAPRRPDYNLQAPPSISAAAIDGVLASYHSPAAGSGATFYDLGLKYGIDPAYALAFYIHESSAGTKGVARATHGIGNIRTTAGYKDYQGYRSYDSYAAGIEDWYKLIRDLYIAGWGLVTPETIIPRYAPWGDNNNPDIYANTVKSLVDSWQAR